LSARQVVRPKCWALEKWRVKKKQQTCTAVHGCCFFSFIWVSNKIENLCVHWRKNFQV